MSVQGEWKERIHGNEPVAVEDLMALCPASGSFMHPMMQMQCSDSTNRIVGQFVGTAGWVKPLSGFADPNSTAKK